jgi:hypothetical protein
MERMGWRPLSWRPWSSRPVIRSIVARRLSVPPLSLPTRLRSGAPLSGRLVEDGVGPDLGRRANRTGPHDGWVVRWRRYAAAMRFHDRALVLYDELLASMGERSAEIAPRPLVSHWPHVGSAYRGLVIVGQALRGWPDDWQASETRTAEGRQRVLAMTRARNADRPDPLTGSHRTRRFGTRRSGRSVAISSTSSNPTRASRGMRDTRG